MYIFLILFAISLLASINSRRSSRTHKSRSNSRAYDTPLYQFALGAAEVLTSDTKVADECLVDFWKIKQPTVEAGHHVWFKDLVEPLLKIREIVGSSIVQVCLKYPNDLRGWLYENLDPTTTAEVKASQVKASPVPATKTRKRRVFLSLGTQRSTTVSKRLRTQHWWKVLERQLPSTVELIQKFKAQLQTILDGYLSTQFNQFIDCISKSVQTEDPLNRQLTAYRSLMRFVFKSKTMSEFLSVFVTLLCNWDQFNAYIETLNNAVNTVENMPRWNLYGKAFGKLVVALATGVNLEGR